MTTIHGPFLEVYENGGANATPTGYCRELGLVIDVLVEMHTGEVGEKTTVQVADEVQQGKGAVEQWF
jgi:hypothetical protein